MARKVCLVTGGTAGLGLATARALAQAGATVVLIGRDPAKADRVTEEIRGRLSAGSIEFMVADLSSQSEVRRLARQFESRYDVLHVLVNNAGAIFPARTLSEDDIEMTLALNHLAYFLLTQLLLDTLKRSAPSRIVNVASSAHARARLDVDDLQLARRYSPRGAYAASKLANLLFTYELARRLEGTGVTVNAVSPGLVATEFSAGYPRNLLGTARRALDRFAKTPEQGADTIVYLATAPEVEGVSGLYYQNRRPIQSSRRSRDEETARRLWELSEQLVT
jgi:NAD(P)-dependent dehydrogenase (short-subunit alcohol dehydrogenase family)